VMVGVARSAGAIGREGDRGRMALRARHLGVSAMRERQLTHGIRNPHGHRNGLRDLVRLSRTAPAMACGATRSSTLGGVMAALTVAERPDRQLAVRALAR